MIIKCSVTHPDFTTERADMAVRSAESLRLLYRKSDACKSTFPVQNLYFFHQLTGVKSSPFLAFVPQDPPEQATAGYRLALSIVPIRGYAWISVRNYCEDDSRNACNIERLRFIRISNNLDTKERSDSQREKTAISVRARHQCFPADALQFAEK
jgi:hypothetical protein